MARSKNIYYRSGEGRFFMFHRGRTLWSSERAFKKNGELAVPNGIPADSVEPSQDGESVVVQVAGVRMRFTEKKGRGSKK